jgi:hypothetical protein
MALEFGTYRLRPRRVEEEGSRELHAALFVSLDGSIHPVTRFATTPVTHWTMEVFENESTLWIPLLIDHEWVSKHEHQRPLDLIHFFFF